jgi:hypothetical protein
MDKHIDKMSIRWENWYVYRIDNTTYQYCCWPPSIGADVQQKITISIDTDESIDFKAEQYFEYSGSGGWDIWTGYEPQLKETLIEDAKKRIRDINEKLLWEK